MSTPVAAFPSRIATSADLKVANNNIQTTLKSPIGTTDTSFQVQNSAGFGANQLVSIGSEIVWISGVTSGVINVTARGFDGTTATAHVIGEPVRLLVDAWHHNASAAEIMAIETFLGPNGTNLSASPYLLTSNFIFAAQSPGGSLIVGTNVITLSPVPHGVNGSDQNHYLYISGGTGTAEAALITGGTAVSGAASGTVIVTCANTHSGAWSIQSASSGLQEAIASVTSAGARILMNANTTLWADVVSSGKDILVEKLPGISLTNNGFHIFSNKNAIGYTERDELISTNGITLCGDSTADNVQIGSTTPDDASVRINRSTNANYAQLQGVDGLYVQHDFIGTGGTPGAIRANLFVPNIPAGAASAGPPAIAGYCYNGWNGTGNCESIGVHGQADFFNPGTVAIGLNAEGSYLGTVTNLNTHVIGVVSNVAAGNTGVCSITGMEVIMNPNAGNAANPEGGIDVHAQTAGTHGYGVKIYDNGGTFTNPILIQSAQANPVDIAIWNNLAGTGTGASTIAFYRSPTGAPMGTIVATHGPGQFSNSSLVLNVAVGGALTPVLTIPYTQVVQVQNAIRPVPIPVAQLPAAASNIGSFACVSDATVTTTGTLVVGGGTNTVSVFCAAAGWKILMG